MVFWAPIFLSGNLFDKQEKAFNKTPEGNRALEDDQKISDAWTRWANDNILRMTKMTLIEKIKQDMWLAKKKGDNLEANLLNTLYSEASRVGKDSGNRDSTDAEVIATIKKFVKNTDETISILVNAGKLAELDRSKRERNILSGYLPTQMSDAELKKVIEEIVKKLPEKSPKAMGTVMAELKAKYNGTFDAKTASVLVKESLT